MGATLLVLLGLALRLWGLQQGYPAFYGHVDEVGVAASIWNFFRQGTLEPTEFTYPAAYSYLVAALLRAAAALGWPPSLPAGGALGERLAFLSYLDPGWSALVGRVLSALAGALTVLVVGRTGTAVAGRRVGCTAALFAAVAVVPVRYGHHALPDVTAQLAAALVMAASWRLAGDGAWRHALLAGAATGLVIGTKFNGALGALAVVSAHAERRRPGWRRRPWRLLVGARLWAAGAVSVLTALAVSPYLLLAWQRYLGVARYQVSSLDFALGVVTPWWWIPRGLVVEELVVGGLMLSGVVLALWRHDVFDRMALAAVVPACLYIGSWTRESLHYLLPYYPFLVVLAARALDDFTRRLWRGSAPAWVAAAVVAAAPSLWRDAALDARLSRPDTRSLAARWIETHVPAGSTLAMTWLPYAPRVDLRQTRQAILAYYAERPAWQAQLRRAWAGRPAYDLINLEAWRSRPVVPEGLRQQVDLDDPETRRVFSRVWRSVDRLLADGVTYVVLPAAVYRRYWEIAGIPGTPAARYRLRMNRAYFQGLVEDPRLELVARLPAAGQDARGGPILVYRVRRPAGT